MIITVQHAAPGWRLLQPRPGSAQAFAEGAVAFDAAAALARAHHQRTGQAVCVQVCALGTAIEVLRVG